MEFIALPISSICWWGFAAGEGNEWAGRKWTAGEGTGGDAVKDNGRRKKGGVVRRDGVQIPRSVNSAHKKTHRLTKSDAVVLNAQ